MIKRCLLLGILLLAALTIDVSSAQAECWMCRFNTCQRACGGINGATECTTTQVCKLECNFTCKFSGSECLGSGRCGFEEIAPPEPVVVANGRPAERWGSFSSNRRVLWRCPTGSDATAVGSKGK
jgi:hypothetical protein